MARTAKSFLYYSLLSALAMMPMDSYAAIRIGNKSRSYADAYNKVNEIRASVAAPSLSSAHSDDLGVVGQTEDSDSTVELPIRVANKSLAAQVASGDSASLTMGQLQKCGSVYPNGEFAWDTPTAGARSGTGSQCVAVVEMRGYQMGPGGTDLVLGRVNVAAGDAVKCNAFAWPNSALLPAAETITFPNDAEPTVEDVIAVMDQEQKQNAGLKIAAGTLIAALAGNALGANEVGSDSLLGTNKEKMQGTAIGGLAGAAIMAGNVYGGKVAGDMILSVGVNAAAGGLIGNMAASNDSVLKFEYCTYSKDGKTVQSAKKSDDSKKNTSATTNTAPTTTTNNESNDTNGAGAKKDDTSAAATVSNDSPKCLWGVLLKSSNKDDNKEYFFHTATETVYECDKEGPKNCVVFNKQTADIMLEGYENKEDANKQIYDLKKMAAENYADAKPVYKLNKETKVMTQEGGLDDERYVKMTTFTIVDDTVPAVIIGLEDKTFGWKKKDWEQFKSKPDKFKITIMGRGANGQPVELSEENTNLAKLENFRPMYEDAEDGALIDLGNKARLKGTLIGAGAGGALGAFTAYQGAQSEIQERWVTAVREYKDSLQKVYCATGTRFLTHYNDTVIIPTVSE